MISERSCDTEDRSNEQCIYLYHFNNSVIKASAAGD